MGAMSVRGETWNVKIKSLALIALLATLHSIPALSRGECDGLAQSLIITVTNGGRLFLQATEMPNFAAIEERIPQLVEPGELVDCIYIRADRNAPWSVVSSVVYPLGMKGSYQTELLHSLTKDGVETPILRWVRNGYQGSLRHL